MNINELPIRQQKAKQMVAALGTEKWLTFPADDDSEEGATALFCAFIPLKKIDDAREKTSWELKIGEGVPGCMMYHQAGEKSTTYLRFGDDDGIEPLLIHREFHGMRPNYVEISEEFRLFHDLYFDSKNNKYIKFDKRGGEEESILFEDGNIKIRVKHIRQFLAVKEMFLAVYFDITYWDKEPLQTLGIIESEMEFRDHDLVYDFAIRNMAGIAERPSLSRLLGKKIIYAYDKSKSGFWPYNEGEEKQYEKFIIGTDEEEEPILYECNPDHLSNYFGANRGAPHFLTPVFFKRDVLGKYYSEPSKYRIHDNILFCGSLWSLRMDNNHPKYIIVYLGDLGQKLSYQEQLYWKSFNVAPDGHISDVEFKRSFLAESADPAQTDLKFKAIYSQFNKRWLQKQGWSLFKPFNGEDEYALATLRIPLTKDFSEFDAQLLYLTKLLVDSLNDAEIQKRVTDLESGARSIAKFEAFLKQSHISDYEPHIRFLRDLYQLRSIGAGHRKGSDYNKKAAAFGVGEKELPEIIGEFLEKAAAMLVFLDKKFLQISKPQTE